MTTYRVQRMTTTSYHNYMTGSYNYSVEDLLIEAETAEEAKELAKKKGYVVNDFVETLAEYEAREAAWKAKIAEERAKEKAAKERKIAREAEKAEAMGLTVEEYKKYKKDKSLINKLPKEIEECKEEIEKLKEAIERKERYLAELKERVNKIEGN